MKLFVVMGVLWIFEAMSWATALLNPQQSHLINNFFLPTDILNTAQGIAIFVIFTCKPNTCRQLDAQFKKFSVFLEEKRGIYSWLYLKYTQKPKPYYISNASFRYIDCSSGLKRKSSPSSHTNKIFDSSMHSNHSNY